MPEYELEVKVNFFAETPEASVRNGQRIAEMVFVLDDVNSIEVPNPPKEVK